MGSISWLQNTHFPHLFYDIRTDVDLKQIVTYYRKWEEEIKTVFSDQPPIYLFHDDKDDHVAQVEEAQGHLRAGRFAEANHSICKASLINIDVDATEKKMEEYALLQKEFTEKIAKLEFHKRSGSFNSKAADRILRRLTEIAPQSEMLKGEITLCANAEATLSCAHEFSLKAHFKSAVRRLQDFEAKHQGFSFSKEKQRIRSHRKRFLSLMQKASGLQRKKEMKAAKGILIQAAHLSPKAKSVHKLSRQIENDHRIHKEKAQYIAAIITWCGIGAGVGVAALLLIGLIGLLIQYFWWALVLVWLIAWLITRE